MLKRIVALVIVHTIILSFLGCNSNKAQLSSNDVEIIVEEEIIKELYGFTASPKKYMSAVSNQSSDGFHDDVFVAFEFHDEQEADDQYDYLMKYLRTQTNATDVIYDHGKIGCILYFGSGDGVVDALPY